MPVRIVCAISVFLLNCSGFVSSISAGEVDRLIAAVNGKVITEGDLKLARNLNALLIFGRETAVPKKPEEVNRLIDLELMRQELMTFPLTSADENTVEERISDLRHAYAEIGGLSALLRRLGLQESELRSYLRLQASLMQFVELRFRPFVAVSTDEIREYYQQKLTPELRKNNAAAPPLEEVAPKIEEVLKEEKVTAAMEGWIRDIRRHARIDTFAEHDSPATEDAK